MLFAEWNQDDANKYYEERGIVKGEQQEREKLIRALKGTLDPEVIAEKFNLSLPYVLEVLAEEPQNA